MDLRFTSLLLAVTGSGLGALYLAAPDRRDLLAAASVGAAFGAAMSLIGFEIIRRAARSSIEKAVQVFLASMVVKVLLFAAFLMTVSLATPLHPAALGAGLAGATLLGEALAIEGIRRLHQ